MNIRIFVLNYLLILICLKINSQEFKQEFKYDINDIKNKSNLIHFAILGSGPAGLSAAIPCGRTGLSTVAFQGPKDGGQIVDSILVVNWPAAEKGPGSKIMENLKNQVLSFGTHIEPDTITEVDFASWPFKLVGQKTYYALSVIIATGAIPKNLCIEGEKEYWLKGIVSCGLCDAHLAKNQHVVIIGGGDTAVERILQLKPYAQSITVVTKNETLCKSNQLSDKIKDVENLKIECNKEVTKFSGDGNKLTSLEIIDKKTNKKSKIKTNWAFVSIGFEPNSQIFKDYLKFDQEGHIIHDPKTQETNIHGVYAAGNVSDERYKQAATASGDGTKAAFNAINFVRSIPFDKQITKFIKANLFIPQKDLKQLNTEIPIIESEEQFNKMVSQKMPTLIDFYSPMCTGCQALDPKIESLYKKYCKRAQFYKFDTTKNMELAKKYNITTLPTLILFQEGKEIKRNINQFTKDALNDFMHEITNQ